MDLGALGPGEGALTMASLSSFADSDPAWLRGISGSSLFIEEDKSRDSETEHGAESVDWLAFSGLGVVSGYEIDPFG